MDASVNLDELRAALTELDGELLALVAKRQALSEQVAAVKRATGRATRDFAREREVILRGRKTAERLGLKPALAESLLRQLIQSSLATQEQARVAAQGHGTGKRALVIGGRGKMGGWFSDFLASQGFQVTIADPRGGVPGFDQLADWEDHSLDCDLIVLATPLRATSEILKKLAQRAPRGLIFDLGSLKTPLRAGLDALVKAGCRVTSLHPMFGPDTELLSGRHVIFIDLGDQGALKEAQELFAPTMAERVVMGLDEHDRLIAYVLGLSHALNIAFFTALAESGEAAPRLRETLEHDVRFANGCGQPGGARESRSLLRDPELERVRPRVARGPARGGGAARWPPSRSATPARSPVSWSAAGSILTCGLKRAPTDQGI